MIWVRIFEHGKSINETVIVDCYMGTLPEVDEIVTDGGGSEVMYRVKSRIFFINHSKDDEQQVALGVVQISKSSGWAMAL